MRNEHTAVSPQRIAALVREELDRQDMSQAELARKLNWSQSYIARRVAKPGRRTKLAPLSLTDLAKVADALEVPMSRFLRPQKEMAA